MGYIGKKRIFAALSTVTTILILAWTYHTDSNRGFMFSHGTFYQTFGAKKNIFSAFESARNDENAVEGRKQSTKTFPRELAVDSDDITKIKQVITTAQWLRYFSHLKDMAVKIVANFPAKETSAKKTRVLLDNNGFFQKGGTLEAQILAKDEDGFPKAYGGDYFIAILRPVGPTPGGVTCPVKDHMNGIYTIKCILPFEGDVKLYVTMLHPSESVFKIMARYSSTHEYETQMKTKVINSKGRVEFADCSVGFPNKRSSDLCNHTNPTHGEAYWCLKPPSGECNPLLSQEMLPNMKNLRFWDQQFFVKGKNYKAIVDVINATVVTSDSSSDNFFINDVTKTSLDPMEPSGWFDGAQWVLRKVRAQPYSVEKFKNCLKGKDLYFVGDSTIKQWYFSLVALFNLTEVVDPKVKNSWSRPRNAILLEGDIKMHFRAHGPPFHNNGEIWPFLTDVLDHVTKGGNGTIVLITIGFHFHLFTPDVFLDRITRIKEAVTSLLVRLPGSKVVVKGLHYHEPRPPFVTSPWKTQLLEAMMRNAFSDVTNVSYFETWDFMLLIGSNVVHPTDDVISKNIEILMSYIC